VKVIECIRKLIFIALYTSRANFIVQCEFCQIPLNFKELACKITKLSLSSACPVELYSKMDFVLLETKAL